MTRRQQLHPAIVELREQGLTFKEIGERLGISLTTAHDYLADPSGERARARRLRNARPCVDRGRLVNLDGRVTNPAERCVPCSVALRKVWTRDAIVAAIRLWADRHDGQPPRVVDFCPSPSMVANARGPVMPRNYDYPHSSCVAREFGSWNAAITAAGYRPREFGKYERSVA